MNEQFLKSDMTNEEACESEKTTTSIEFFPPKKPAIFLFIGSPGRGKSFALSSLMYSYAKMGYFHYGMVFCKTKFNDAYSWCPEENVYDRYDEDKIKHYVQYLGNYREKTKRKPPPSFIILDDMIGEMSLGTGFITNLLCTYRHFNLSIFITTQYLMGRGTSTVLRNVVSYAIMFKTIFKNSLRGLYESFGQLFDSYDDFREHFIHITNTPYHAMLYIANQDSFEESYHDVIFQPNPPFQLVFRQNRDRAKRRQIMQNLTAAQI